MKDSFYENHNDVNHNESESNKTSAQMYANQEVLKHLSSVSGKQAVQDGAEEAARQGSRLASLSTPCFPQGRPLSALNNVCQTSCRPAQTGEVQNEEGMVVLSADEYLVLKRSLEASETRIHDLASENKQLQYEVESLQQNMLQLVEENAALRHALQQLTAAGENGSQTSSSSARKSSVSTAGNPQIPVSQSLILPAQDAVAAGSKDSVSRDNRDTFLLNENSNSNSNSNATDSAKSELSVATAAPQSATPLSSPSNATGSASSVLAASGGDSVARYTDALAKQLRDLVKAVNDGSSARYAILCNAVDVNVKEMFAAFLSALNEDALDDARWRDIQQCVSALQDGARELKDSAANIVQQRRASFTVSASSSSGQSDASAYANADWANQVKAHFLIYTMGKALRSFIACLNK